MRRTTVHMDDLVCYYRKSPRIATLPYRGATFFFSFWLGLFPRPRGCQYALFRFASLGLLLPGEHDPGKPGLSSDHVAVEARLGLITQSLTEGGRHGVGSAR